MTPIFKVITPGVYSSFQDNGRQLGQDLGFSLSGAMDQRSMHLANRLLQNNEDSCTVEITVGGFEVEALDYAQVTLTGGAADVWVNGRRENTWSVILLNPRDRFKVGYCRAGYRCYFAVAGGFQTDKLFSSASTVKHELLSSLHGVKIEAGSLLYKYPSSDVRLQSIPYNDRPIFTRQLCVRVIVGFQCNRFSERSLIDFFSTSYRVSKNSDRMAYRVQGEKLDYQGDTIYSEPLVLGAIQIPADGQPIIMMRDYQTLGGYPKLGTVAKVDQDKLGQLPPGSQLYFSSICAEEASLLWQAYVKEEHAINTVELISHHIDS